MAGGFETLPCMHFRLTNKITDVNFLSNWMLHTTLFFGVYCSLCEVSTTPLSQRCRTLQLKNFEIGTVSPPRTRRG